MRRIVVAATAGGVLVVSAVLILVGDPGLECGRSGELQGIDCLDSFPNSARFGDQPAESLGWEVLFGAMAVSTIALLYLLVSSALTHKVERW